MPYDGSDFTFVEVRVMQDTLQSAHWALRWGRQEEAGRLLDEAVEDWTGRQRSKRAEELVDAEANEVKQDDC